MEKRGKGGGVVESDSGRPPDILVCTGCGHPLKVVFERRLYGRVIHIKELGLGLHKLRDTVQIVL